MLNTNSQVSLNHDGLGPLYTCGMSIGARVRQLRIQHGLSQESFGELCGVSKGMVSQWESDIVRPPTDRLLKLREHIEFSFDWMLTGVGSATVENGVYVTKTKEKLVLQAMEKMGEYQKDTLIKISHTLAEPEGENGPKQATQ